METSIRNFILAIVITILALLFTVVFLSYVSYKYHYNHFNRKNIPHLPPIIPYGNLGNARQIIYSIDNPGKRRNPFCITAAAIYSKFKAEGHAYAGMYTATSHSLILISPDLVKRVMSTDFSSFTARGFYYNEKWDPLSANLLFMADIKWLIMRVKLRPTFTSGNMKMMFQTLVDCSVPLSEEIAALVKAKQTLDIKELVECFTTDVIGSCAFGLECNSFKNPDAEFRKNGRKIFEFGLVKNLVRLIIYNNLSKKNGVRFFPKDVTEFFTKAVNNVVDYREKAGFTRNDFMQLLIELKRKGEFQASELAPQAFVFFLAGFETSSTTLTYLLFELSQNQEIQNKVREEIRKMLKTHNGITYEGLADLKYTSQAISEALRKYPALPFLTRDCTETYKVPDSDVVLEKGDRVTISTYGLHMDPEYFPEPAKFDPERFSDENRERINPFTYIPFGVGPRHCIGMRFAMDQIKVALIAILEKYRLHLNSKTPNSLTWDSTSLYFEAYNLKANETIYLDAELID